MKQRGSLLKDMSILLFFSALVRAFFAFTCLNLFASAMNLRLFDGAQQGGQLTERIEPQLFAFFFDNLLMMLQFSYSCEYYQERMRIFCGEAALEDTKMADRLTRFLLGAMKGDVCSSSSRTTSERPESRPACSEPNRISG